VPQLSVRCETVAEKHVYMTFSSCVDFDRMRADIVTNKWCIDDVLYYLDVPRDQTMSKTIQNMHIRHCEKYMYKNMIV
jgi:hypothetical protein